jgi:hypothetical protein
MTPDDRAALIEEVSSAHREARPDGIRAHRAWFDLDDAGRVEAFDATVRLRAMEAALDNDGLSTTARRVLERILGAQPEV